jgi:hypothetical protein
MILISLKERKEKEKEKEEGEEEKEGVTTSFASVLSEYRWPPGLLILTDD